MANQQLSRASPSEEYIICHKVMDDAVELYLPSCGPAITRQHIEILANELMRLYGDDCKIAYQEAMAKITQAEKEEQQRTYERKQQEMQQMMMTVMGVIQNVGNTANPSAGKDSPNNGKTVLPPKLSTDKAMLMWQQLQKAGYIDDNYQPARLSRTQMAIVAFEMSKRLGIKNKWKTFETLWHKNNLRVEYNISLNQKKSLKFWDDLKQLFAAIQK